MLATDARCNGDWSYRLGKMNRSRRLNCMLLAPRQSRFFRRQVLQLSEICQKAAALA
jgi:hypothetical protein